jgi:8-oxo-dGTP pyrophosphatase MutT (NUDIX family)
MSRQFITHAIKTIHKTSHFTFNVMDVETDGVPKDFPQLLRIPAVMIIPITPTGRTVLVRQYRYPVQQEMWEFCAGGIDAGEDPDVSARRELIEECGLSVDTIEFITEFQALPSAAINSFRLYVTYVSDDVLNTATHREGEDEILFTRIVHLNDIRDMILSGEFNSGTMLAAYGVLTAYLERARTGGQGG